MNTEMKVTEGLIKTRLNEAAALLGWPKHITDQAAAEKLMGVWGKLFAGRPADQFNRGFDAALKTGRFFPVPADIEESMHDRCAL